MVTLNIAAAVLFILLGTRYLRKGLDRIFGSRLLDWLERMTSNRYMGFLAGVTAGAIAPSSSTLVFLSLQTMRQAALSSAQMLALFLGGSVGITSSVQLISIRLQDYAGIFIVVGGIGFLFGKRALVRGLGQSILALGLIFHSMWMLGIESNVITQSQDLRTIFEIFEHYPFLLMIGTALLTVLLQSSTASLGLGIGLSLSGLIGYSALLPWVLGANLGIAFTVFLAGWGTTEGRKLAVGNLIIKGSAAVALLILAEVEPNFFHKHLPGAPDRLAADLHTGFNLIVGLLALPLLGPLSWVLEKWFITEKDDADLVVVHLDDALLDNPSLALNQATREQMRAMDELKFMLLIIWTALFKFDEKMLGGIDRHIDRFEAIRNGLNRYLSLVGGNDVLDDRDTQWKLSLTEYGWNLETIAQLLRRDLVDAVRFRLNRVKLGPLTPEEMKILEPLVQKTVARFELAYNILMTRNPDQAALFIHEKEEINTSVRQLQKEIQAMNQPLEFQRFLLDFLGCLRRINGHLTGVAYYFAPHLEEELASETQMQNVSP